MSLTGTFVDQDFGFFDDALKPITDGGVKVVQVDEKPEEGFWSFLDVITTPIANGIGIATQGWVDQELNSHGYHDPQAVSSTGSPDDRTGNVKSDADSFITKYKKELLIGGGLLAVVAVILLVKK